MPVQTLPTITKVEFIRNEDLELYPRKFLKPGDTTSAIGNFEKLNMPEPAQCEITSAQTPNGLTYTTRITGVIFDEDNSELRDKLQALYYNYRLTDIYRNKYLVGTKQKPFPEILFNPVNPASPAARRVINFEITWVSGLPPIKIVDL